jgi:hypothetical protein
MPSFDFDSFDGVLKLLLLAHTDTGIKEVKALGYPTD